MLEGKDKKGYIIDKDGNRILNADCVIVNDEKIGWIDEIWDWNKIYVYLPYEKKLEVYKSTQLKKISIQDYFSLQNKYKFKDNTIIKEAKTLFNKKLHDELVRHANEDQDARKLFSKSIGNVSEKDKAFVKSIDANNRIWLKNVIETYGWPGKSLVGEDGAKAAWLIAQHSDNDIKFQELCLNHLTKAVELGEADELDLAYLTDRVAVNTNKKQLYGTQLQFNNNKFTPYPIENEKMVNKHRTKIGLPSLEEYINTQNTSFGITKPTIKEAKSKKEHQSTICIDLDGVIAKKVEGSVIGEPIEGSQEFLLKLEDLGWKIIIFTCRPKSMVVPYMEKYGLQYNEINENTDVKLKSPKPIADVYLDDRGLTFEGDFDETLDKIIGFEPWWEEGKIVKESKQITNLPVLPDRKIIYVPIELVEFQDEGIKEGVEEEQWKVDVFKWIIENKKEYPKDTWHEYPPSQILLPLEVSPEGNKYVCYDGNHRLMAYKQLGYKEVPITLYHPEEWVDWRDDD